MTFSSVSEIDDFLDAISEKKIKEHLGKSTTDLFKD